MDKRYLVLAVVGVLVLLLGLAMPPEVTVQYYNCTPDSVETTIVKNANKCDGEAAPWDRRWTNNDMKMPVIAIGIIGISVGAAASLRAE